MKAYSTVGLKGSSPISSLLLDNGRMLIKWRMAEMKAFLPFG